MLPARRAGTGARRAEVAVGEEDRTTSSCSPSLRIYTLPVTFTPRSADLIVLEAACRTDP